MFVAIGAFLARSVIMLLRDLGAFISHLRWKRILSKDTFIFVFAEIFVFSFFPAFFMFYYFLKGAFYFLFFFVRFIFVFLFSSIEYASLFYNNDYLAFSFRFLKEQWFSFSEWHLVKRRIFRYSSLEWLLACFCYFFFFVIWDFLVIPPVVQLIVKLIELITNIIIFVVTVAFNIGVELEKSLDYLEVFFTQYTLKKRILLFCRGVIRKLLLLKVIIFQVLFFFPFSILLLFFKFFLKVFLHIFFFFLSKVRRIFYFFKFSSASALFQVIFKSFFFFVLYFFKGFFFYFYLFWPLFLRILYFVCYVLLKIPFFKTFFYGLLLYLYILFMGIHISFLQLINIVTKGYYMKQFFSWWASIKYIFFYFVYLLCFFFYAFFSVFNFNLNPLIYLDLVTCKIILSYYFKYKQFIFVRNVKVFFNRLLFLRIYLFFYRKRLQIKLFFFKKLD